MCVCVCICASAHIHLKYTQVNPFSPSSVYFQLFNRTKLALHQLVYIY